MTPAHSIIHLAICLALLSANAAQVVPGVQMGSTSFPLPTLAVAPFKQTLLTWDNPPGASNRIAWGTVRNAWTNDARVINTNVFPVSNGWTYCVTAIVSGVESIPAIWPSNKVERVWVQTSTNLLAWKDGFVWRTNYALPQEYLRLRHEIIRWE